MLTPSPPQPKLHHFLIAFGTGCLLTAMVHLNSELAHRGGALFASWTVHGVGALAALAAVLLSRGRLPAAAGGKARAPGWAYLGGLSGAATVMATSTAVNGPIGLSGTVALGLAGQAVFALAADRWGFFGLAKRRPDRIDALSLALILAGSGVVILFARVP